MTSPRLALNLIPATMWGKNVRAVVAAATWEFLRWRFNATGSLGCRIDFDVGPEVWAEREAYKSVRPCAICGAEHGTLELHEEWEFDDVSRVQRLAALIPICSACHLAKHIGHAHRIGQFDRAAHHLANINGWSIQQANVYAADAMTVWKERSRFEYVLDLALLEGIVPSSRIHLNWLGTLRSWFASRLDSVAWSHDMLGSNALIIDTETTGLPSKEPDTEIIELAALNSRGRVLYEGLFRPSKPIRNWRIHGITNRAVRGAPAISTEWDRICRLFDGRVIVSYNARFEREAFLSTSTLYGLPMPDCQWGCAMQAWWTFNRLPYTKLPDAEHRAKGDARQALRLLRTMAAAANDDGLLLQE